MKLQPEEKIILLSAVGFAATVVAAILYSNCHNAKIEEVKATRLATKQCVKVQELKTGDSRSNGTLSNTYEYVIQYKCLDGTRVEKEWRYQ